MSAIGYAVLPMTVSMKGLGATLSRELNGPAMEAGRKAADDLGKSMVDGTRQAAAEVKRARKAEEDAAKAVTAAEKALSDQRSKAEQDARKIESAEAKLTAARQKGTSDVTKAERDLAAARESADVDRITDAESKLAQVRARTDASLIDKEVALDRARDAAAASADKVADAEDGVAQAKDKAAEASENVISATRRYDDALDGSTDSVVDMSKELRELQDDLNGAGEKAMSFGERLQSGLMEVGRGALLGIGAKIGTSVMSGVQSAVQGGWQSALDIDTGTRVLEGMYDSAESAQSMLVSLREVSRNSPIDHSSYLDAAQALAYTGVQGDSAVQIMENVGLAALASGKDGDQAFQSMNGALARMVNEGKVGLESLQQLSGAGVPILSGLAEHFGVSMADINKMATEGAIGFEDVLSVMENATGDYFQTALTAGADASTSLENQLKRIKDDIFTTVGESLAPILAEMDWEAIGAQVSNLAESFTTLVPVLMDVAMWVMENSDWLLPLAGIIGGVTTAVWLLNAAMAVNPFVLVAGAVAALVGGLVWFFAKTEAGQGIWESFMGTLGKAKDFFVDIIDFGKMVVGVLFGGDFAGAPFGLEEDSALIGWLFTIRETVLSVWEGIKAAFSVAWSFIEPIFTGFKFAFAIVATAALLWWEAVKLYWDLASSLIVWTWNSVIKPVWDLMQVGLQALGDFFGWVWNSIIKPVWDALGAGIAWVWDNIVRPTWDLLKAGLGLVGDAFSFYWNNVIKPVWDALGAGINWVWINVISPAWEMLKTALGAVGTFFQWVWNSVIKPAWDALGTGIKLVADTVIHPVFEGLKTGLGYIETAFSTAVDFIDRMWGRMREITAKPVKFVIDSVYNDGIRGVWNKVAGWLGLEELPEWRPRWLGDYNAGGVLPGHTPGRDIYEFIEPRTGLRIGLGGGEGIMRPEFVDAVGGPRGIERLNSAARHGRKLGFDGDLGGYAGGGVVESIVSLVGQYFPGMSITSTYRNTADHHGSGLAVDFSNGTDTTPQMQAAARFFHDNYGPGLLELIHWPLNGWQNLKNGSPLNYGEPTNSQHRNHVHVAAPSPLGPPGSPITPIDSGGGSGTSMIGSLVSRAFSAIMDPIVGALPDFGGGLWGEMPGALVKKIVDGARQFFGSKTPGAGGGDYTPGSGPVVDQVRQAMARYGWDVEPYWSAVDFIIGKESGWNPLATNPSSGAFGLPQFNPMGGNTLGAYLPDRNPNPGVQGAAMARYISDRYGNPLAARDFWVANNWYDQGGYLMPGATMAVNETGKPEPVFTAAQWSLLERQLGLNVDLVEELRRMVLVINRDADDRDELAAQAVYDVFGREPLGPNLHKVLHAGPRAWNETAAHLEQIAATGDYLENEWFTEGSQLAEAARAVYRGRVGFDEWASASEEQGRMGTPEEFAQHYGQQVGAELLDGALGLVGLDGLIGGQWKQSIRDFAEAGGWALPGFGPSPVLDDDGRVPGTRLERVEAAVAESTEAATSEAASVAATREAPRQPITIIGDSIPADQVEELLGRIEGVEFDITRMKGERASITTRKVLA